MLARRREVEECILEIQLLLIDWPRAAYSERLKTALELNKSSKMLAIVRVDAQHIALKKKIIPEWLLPPIVVAGLLPHFSRFSAERQIPIGRVAPQRDVFDGVPAVLPKASLVRQTPVPILPQQLIAPISDYRGSCFHCLSVRDRQSDQQGSRQD